MYLENVSNLENIIVQHIYLDLVILAQYVDYI